MTLEQAKDLAWQTIRADSNIVRQVIALLETVYASIEPKEIK